MALCTISSQKKGSLDGHVVQYRVCKHDNFDWLLQLDEALQLQKDGEVSFIKGASLNARAIYTQGDVWFNRATTNLWRGRRLFVEIEHIQIAQRCGLQSFSHST